jgi:prepilin-type N-terminal cleavage/methylation domain-containing protein
MSVLVNKETKAKSRGFTLVELSIVLLIIGLIIGGITAGSSLIKQAQIR